ncbi:nucleotidyltransferase family protein [Paenibacillus sp. Marseille-Q4541]|uniref:nucleotidyltransferase family protein n=1 Tax=Paenibacillus sp. Marseille-Q4541 TaxID=2831522 RepID=UPI001BAAE0D3|nr:nucleotidyltransferase family protein [Paenibacillus sp. Marseille-Q4541]
MNQPQIVDDLKRVRELRLPQACIAAGYVRNRVWDELHEYKSPTPLNDIDVIYYDPEHVDEWTDTKYEQQLQSGQIGRNWQVKNQARMHEYNMDPPYQSVEDAMRYWPETATAVAIRLNDQDELEIIAPFGLTDLFEMNVKKSPYFRNTALYKQRVFEKEWLDHWPLLLMMDS